MLDWLLNSWLDWTYVANSTAWSVVGFCAGWAMARQLRRDRDDGEARAHDDQD